MRARGEGQAAIGYQTYVWEFIAQYHAIDPRYKVGANVDYLLWRRHGLINTDTCAEGLSRADEFRIVQGGPATAPDRFLDQTEFFRADRCFGQFMVVRAE